ncbi:MAG: universal stress protein [Austwickia sp.]|nr:universal stress protein [Austwickia sp.]MBK8437576.1 universal stress protein [Austwickia sp.]MBK9102841.1 universal stress protein [Austwickia sp.]
MTEVHVNSIVVGVDGSPTSQRAVRWAAYLADRWSVPLEVLAAYGAPLTLEVFAGFSTRYSQQVHDAARAHLDEGLAAAGEAAPGLTLVERFVDRPPARALLEAGAADRLLVIGKHGANRHRLGNLGSVTDQVVTHAHGPVVVIPADEAPALAGKRIVVGSDASPHSVAALWFALEVARAAGSPLTVLHGWGFDYLWMGAPVAIEQRDIEELRDRSQEALKAVAGPIVARYPEVEVDWVLERNTPADALRAAGESAGLIVVGRRGHGGFQALLLGSTSRALTHAAPCPVAVIPS